MPGDDDEEVENGLFVSLVIPEGAVAGVDSLTFQYGDDGGQEFEVLIPEGSVAGDVLRIQVGERDLTTPTSDGDSSKANAKSPKSSLLEELGGGESDESSPIGSSKSAGNDDIEVVRLGDGTVLKLGSSQKQTQGQGDGDGTSVMVWPAGRILAETLTSNLGIEFLNDIIKKSDGDPIRCLEVGSGLGVCGLALAHALSAVDGAKPQCEVLLTDLCVNALNENIRRNPPPSPNVRVSAGSHTWGNALQFKTDEFKLIIGADLIYDSKKPFGPLLSTIYQQLDRENGVVVLAVRWRKPDLERCFFAQAEEKGLVFELWPSFVNSEFSNRCPCKLSWEEYGNPQCEASNEYFHNRKVMVDGKLLPFSGITEVDMEKMSANEYLSFEESQIQLLTGRFSDAKNRKKLRLN